MDQIDSLKNKASDAPDSLKPDLYLKIMSSFHKLNDPHNALHFARKAYEAASTQDDTYMACYTLFQLGNAEHRLRYEDSAAHHFRLAIGICENMRIQETHARKFRVLLVKLYRLMGSVLCQQRMCDSALRIYDYVLDNNLVDDTASLLMAKIYLGIAWAYYHQHLPQKAIKPALKAEKIIYMLDDEGWKININKTLGSMFVDVDFETAAEYFLKTSKLIDSSNDAERYIQTKVFINTVLHQYGYHIPKKIFINLYNQLKEKNDYDSMGWMLRCLADLASYPDSSIQLAKESAILFQKVPNPFSVCKSHLATGRFFTKARNYDSAMYYYDLVDSINKRFNDRDLIYKVTRDRANTNKDLGYYKRAYPYYKKAIKLNESMHDFDDRVSILENFYELLCLMGKHREAFRYLEEYNKLNDSIYNISREARILAMKTQHDILQMNREKKLLEKTREIQNTKLQQRQSVIRVFAGGLIVVSIALFLFLKQLKGTRMAYSKLVEANVSIIDSETRGGQTNVREASSAVPADKIFNNLMAYLDRSQDYLNPSFSLKYLSKRLKTNTSYLSKTINDKTSKNFNTFINEYRIEEAQKLMTKSEYRKYSIEGIAQCVGFKSKSSFNSAFKKQTGLTPSQYLTYLDKQTKNKT